MLACQASTRKRLSELKRQVELWGRGGISLLRIAGVQAVFGSSRTSIADDAHLGLVELREQHRIEWSFRTRGLSARVQTKDKYLLAKMNQ
jgi:hypothetical protein